MKSTLDQVPKGCYCADVAAHGCIHLGRSAHNRPCHWILDNGCMDSSHPEIHSYYCCDRRHFSCGSKYNTHYHKWWSSLHVWNMVSLQCHKESDLRTDQHNTGKSVCNQVGLQCIDLHDVIVMHTRPKNNITCIFRNSICDSSVPGFRNSKCRFGYV